MNKNQIENVLIELGIPASINGFVYITDALLILNKEENRNVKFTYLYHMIARKNDSTPARVERSIRHAFDLARNCKTDFEIVDHYIGFVNCSNSASLKMLYMRIAEENQSRPEQKKEPVREAKEEIIGISEEQIKRLVREMLKETLREILRESA